MRIILLLLSTWSGVTYILSLMLQSLRAHVGPVFALCATTEGTCVLSSGADPSLIQFECVSEVSGDKWVRTAAKSQHTHDVRSLVYTGSHIVSAGE